MLLSEDTVIKWNSKNKRYYENLGYTYTKMRDEFAVRIEDLTEGSAALVEVLCDYCGKTYTVSWRKYLEIHRRSEIDKDCCKSCCELKARDAIVNKFGSYKESFQKSNTKRTATNIERYGSANVFASDIIKEKIKNTCLEKYGVHCTANLDSVMEKRKSTCLEKYGVEHYVELFKGKFIGKNSPNWKGGVEYSRVERATHEYNNWRKNVFTRDHFICQWCGDKNVSKHKVELNAHHIKNWKDNPDDRYDVDNGITLCQKCHNRFHSIYGKHNNTKTQLESFLLDNKVC